MQCNERIGEYMKDFAIAVLGNLTGISIILMVRKVFANECNSRKDIKKVKSK